MPFAKLQMSKDEKKIIAISVAISVFLIVLAMAYIIVRRIKNREILKLMREAAIDFVFWSGKTETDPIVSSTLVDYWKTAGVSFTKNQMQDASVHSTYPWSSAYISDLVTRSGFENFKPSTTHAKYVLDAKKNRSTKLKPSYWAFKPSENQKVEIGDILVAPRGSNPTLDTLTASTPTHGDIVIGFEKENGNLFAIAQGGNVGNTVKQRRFLLTKSKTLSNTGHFAHLKYIK